MSRHSWLTLFLLLTFSARTVLCATPSCCLPPDHSFQYEYQSVVSSNKFHTNTSNYRVERYYESLTLGKSRRDILSVCKDGHMQTLSTFISIVKNSITFEFKNTSSGCTCRRMSEIPWKLTCQKSDGMSVKETTIGPFPIVEYQTTVEESQLLKKYSMQTIQVGLPEGSCWFLMEQMFQSNPEEMFASSGRYTRHDTKVDESLFVLDPSCPSLEECE